MKPFMSLNDMNGTFRTFNTTADVVPRVRAPLRADRSRRRR